MHMSIRLDSTNNWRRQIRSSEEAIYNSTVPVKLIIKLYNTTSLRILQRKKVDFCKRFDSNSNACLRKITAVAQLIPITAHT